MTAHLRTARAVRLAAATIALAASALSPAPGAHADAAAVADDGRIAAGAVLRFNVPEAFGGKTVVGQLTVDRALGPGFVTAFGCDDGIPTDADGNVSRSDLNYDGTVSPVASNRLIVEADDDGDVCLYTLRPAALVVDINAMTFDTGVTSFPNRRTDTRTGSDERVEAGGVLRVEVPEAVGGRTVVGELTVDRVSAPGFVTAYPCADGIPTTATGRIDRSDLNYDPAVSTVAANRLVVEADADGAICFYTLSAAALVVDLNGVADVGITSFPNRRVDTRGSAGVRIGAGEILRVSVPEAAGGRTVIGQLSVDRVMGAGFVTAFACDAGIPTDADGDIARSDLNYDGGVSAVSSNRLIVQADAAGDVCFYTLRPAALIVDVNAVSEVGISSFPNRRIDTRSGALPAGSVTLDGVPVWPERELLPPLAGVAALTGLPADADVTGRPVLAVKIDNYGPARPQWGLDQADAVIEENVEGVTRFIALFQSVLPSVVGPVRSARTGDLDLLAAMNRPVFAYSGANSGVMQWIDAAAGSGVLVDFTAQRQPCYARTADRPGPHNLLLDPACATAVAAASGAEPGPARSLWSHDGAWDAGTGAVPDAEFDVAMDGVRVGWTWDVASGSYVRTQDGVPHLSASGAQISAGNVVVVTSEHVPSPVDARSPNPITVGTGEAVVHRDGIAVAVVWSRATAFDPFEFSDASTGVPVPLDTGTTWIELTRAG